MPEVVCPDCGELHHIPDDQWACLDILEFLVEQAEVHDWDLRGAILRTLMTGLALGLRDPFWTDRAFHGLSVRAIAARSREHQRIAEDQIREFVAEYIDHHPIHEVSE